MREIVSPLSGIRSPFGARRNPLAAYRAGGFTPKLVAQFADDFYGKEGRKSTFDGVLEPTATTNGTMVDSDGLLKWRPHNEATNPTAPATQTITVVSGADYTVECTGVSIALSGAGTGTVTEGSPVEITAGSTSLTLTVTGSTGTITVYRSDLGGMVNNPDTGTSFVPTTGYLPRRGHHIYNGSAWVDEGVLIEPETRTNLITYPIPDSNWSPVQATISENVSGITAPDGTETASKAVESTSSTTHRVDFAVTIANGVTHAYSIFAKEAGRDTIVMEIGRGSISSNYARFDLSSGTVAAEVGSAKGFIEAFGNGWYRCSVVAAAGSFDKVLLGIWDGTNQSYAGDGSSGVYLWGAQLEEGSSQSSYIPTTGSQVARAGEQLVLPHENISWPEPKVIGSEQVTNGTFDTDLTGWTVGNVGTPDASNGWEWSAGQARCFSDGSFVTLEQEVFDSTSDKVYLLSFDVDATTGTVKCGSNRSNALGFFSSLGTGSYSTVVSAASLSSNYLVFGRASGATDVSIDNISVKEIEPLAVSIHIQGRMTYADTGIINETVFVRWAADSSNGIVLGIDTDGADTGQFKAYQAALGVADRAETVGDYFTPGVNVSFNVASRHGSTFINGAVDGVALTENTTPTTFPDLETTNLELAYSGGSMVIKEVSLWDVNITDAGTEDATDD